MGSTISCSKTRLMPMRARRCLGEKSLNFHELMQQVETHQLAASLYILDACRVSPFRETSASAKSGQLRGLAAIESLYGAFVMYSAGPDEEALDFLADPKNGGNSVYARHLLPLLTDNKISLVEIAKRVQVQVEEDGKKVSHQQRPAYFDGIVGHYYLANPESSQKPLGPADRITGDNVIRLGAYATWNTRCQSRPAPRVSICAPLRYGRIVTRYETYKAPSQQFGSAHCVGTTQQGVAVYYFINPQYQAVNAFERIEVEARHWTISPSVTTRDTFEVNLATKTTKRTARPSLTRRQ
jgi:Caspase domain